MATKLKNLKVTKVDFVDEGANPDAHIMLYKSRGGTEGTGTGGSESGGRSEGFWKRFVSAVFKTAGMKQEELDTAMDQLQKSGAVSFGENMAQRDIEKVSGEMWDIFYALHGSFTSILRDDELDGAAASEAMQEGLDDFYNMVKGAIKEWSDGKLSGIVVKKADVLETGDGKEPERTKKEEPKGDKKEMKIDKSKMTPAERAFYEEIEKRCGTDDGNTGGAVHLAVAVPTQTAAPATRVTAVGEDAVAKALQMLGMDSGTAAEALNTGGEEEDIYKGLNPDVKAEIEALKKFREETEEKELRQVAKSYAIIGKKEEELLPVLKSVKAAGMDAYNQLISALDDAKAAVEKSGAFTEIGKSGYRLSATPGANENSSEAKISGIAKGYMEKDPGMSYTDAVAKAWEDNPELMAAYEEEAGF